MVDLEPLDDVDTHVAGRRHRPATATRPARRSPAGILDRLAVPACAHFVKVMPRDYKRVLAAIKVAEEQGVDVDEAIMAAAKG